MAQACSKYTAWCTVTARDSEVRCEASGAAAPRARVGLGTRPLEPLGSTLRHGLGWRPAAVNRRTGVFQGEGAKAHAGRSEESATHGSVWI